MLLVFFNLGAKILIFLEIQCFFAFFFLALRHCEEVRRSNPGIELVVWIASFLAMTKGHYHKKRRPESLLF